MRISHDIRFTSEGLPAPDLSDVRALGVVEPPSNTTPYTGTIAVISATEMERAEVVDKTHLYTTCGAFLERCKPQLAPTDGVQLEFAADPRVLSTSTGATFVRYYHHCGGIPVYESGRVVQMDPDGRLVRLFGDNAPVAATGAAAPRLGPDDATLAAALYLAEQDEDLRVTKRRPTILRRFSSPTRPTLLRKRPFADGITAELTYFYHRPALRLAWSVYLSLPGDGESYFVMVDAEDGQILTARDLAFCAVRADVFPTNPGGGGRQRVTLPNAWLSGNRLEGNNAQCTATNGASVLTGVRNGADLEFFPPLPDSSEQRQVNAFFWVNRAHDFFGTLGFDEAHGSFQAVNPGGSPGAGDRLKVTVFDGEVSGLGRMERIQSGSTVPLMRLGLNTTNSRHAALAADIILHEYAHGVTQRTAERVGHPFPFGPADAPSQAASLSEGLSDFFALALLSRERDTDIRAFGVWVGASRTGAYDSAYPGHYGKVGTAPYDKAHTVGEIVCVALLRFADAAVMALGGRDVGYTLALQVVFDGLKHLPIGPDAPNFLQARKAFQDALIAHVGAQSALVEAFVNAFTHLGMGPLAHSQGVSFQGIVPDFGGGSVTPL